MQGLGLGVFNQMGHRITKKVKTLVKTPLVWVTVCNIYEIYQVHLRIETKI